MFENISILIFLFHLFERGLLVGNVTTLESRLQVLPAMAINDIKTTIPDEITQ